ncbi:MAG: hypothetical protein IPO64_13015 [Bacteroidetes bacterium]|nr:hypothetical protein [Bacteroidota bacterium]
MLGMIQRYTSSDKIVLNDLDLEILDPNGQTVFALGFGKNYDDIAVRGRDSLVITDK